MALTNHDQAKIRQYLLGHLSDEEQQEIEGRLMTEDDLFEELEISKGELIEVTFKLRVSRRLSNSARYLVPRVTPSGSPRVILSSPISGLSGTL